MTKHEIISSAGERIIRCIRDYTISQFEDLMAGRIKAPDDQDLQYRIGQLSPESRKILHDIGIRLVDETLHNFLWMLEGGERLELICRAPDGEVANLTELSDGLPGELYGPEGWIAKFSRYSPSVQ